jgi:tetratricopeptide (TPR) repeat protein
MPPASQFAAELTAAPDARSRRALVRAGAVPEGALALVLAEVRKMRREAPGKAAGIARTALAAARRGGVQADVAAAARALAGAHTHLGRPRAALRRLEQAVAAGGASLRVQLAPDRALALATLGRSEEAFALLHEARRGLRGPRTARLRAVLDISEATLLGRLDRHAEALVLLDRARTVLQRLDQPGAMAAVDHNRANLLTNMCQHEHAERIYRRVASQHARDGAHASALQSEYNLTYLQFLRGRFHQALARMSDLRGAFDALGDQRHVALCDLDEAEMLLRLNMPSDARERAVRAASELDRLGVSQDAARARFLAAIAQRNLGDESGLRALEAAHEELGQRGLPAWQAIALHRLAEADREAGRFEQARDRALAASRELARLGMPDRAGRAEVLAARIEDDLGRPEHALKLLEGLRRRVADLPDAWLRCELHVTAARAARRLGRGWTALAHALRAVRTLERHRVAVPPDEFMAAFLRDKAGVYEEALRCLLSRPGRATQEKAFEVAEAARGQALLDLLRNRAIAPGGGTAARCTRRANQLEAEIGALLAQLPTGEGKVRSVGSADVRAAVRVREGWLERCLDRLEVLDPEEAQLRRPRPLRIADLRAALPSDATLVEFFVSDEAVTTFIVTRSELRIVRNELPRTALEGMVGRARFHLDRPAAIRKAYGPVGRAHLALASAKALGELHDALIAPIAELLSTPRLLVVPHGVLHSVPFHALGRDGRVLLETHEIEVLPSVGIWLHARAERRPSRARGCLVLGVPDERAPLIADEVRQVAAMHPGAELAVGADAKRELLLKRGRHARMIHLACHAQFRDGDATLAALQMGDGWLTLPEIYGMRLSADLVVLSGCATGRSWVAGGDELFGLVRGFLHAGVGSLVASLWQVSDDSAALLMQILHAELANGKPPAAALRAAALAVRAEHPDPHHWAPFALIGASTRVGSSQPSSS